MIAQPTLEEQRQLAAGEAIGYYHDGTFAVVRVDAFPKELAAYQRQCERQEAQAVKREALRKSAPRGVKISRKMAKARGLL